MNGNSRFASLPRAEYAPPAQDTRNFPLEQADAGEDSGVSAGHSCRGEPHLLPHNRILRHRSDAARSGTDSAKGMGGATARCKKGSWRTRRPSLLNGQPGVASFGWGTRRAKQASEPPSARSKAMPPSGNAAAVSGYARLCAPQGLVFYLPTRIVSLSFQVTGARFQNCAVESGSSSQPRSC